MAKVRYANTARINRKPDGSIVVSLYVNESKEYFNKAVARARTARTTATRRKVKISKTDKERHREKIKISGYLEANQWEYVLRVPVPNNNHAVVWRSFTEKYRYRHKYAPLQYLMIKGAGELYGVISNAPVEDGKIPMVDIEHEVLGVFNVSMIGAMERMTLQYNRTGTDKAYMNSKGLNKKTYDYINLDNIEQFELPDDALLTVGQASIVFDGGTAEENEKAVQQFLSEKKVQKVAENKYKEHAIKELKKCLKKQNRFKNIAPSIAVDFENLEILEPEIIMFEGRQRTLIDVKYQGQIVYREIDGESMLDRRPVIYIIFNRKTGQYFYIGLAKEPLNRYCDHFGINDYVYKGKDGNSSKFYKYVKANGLSFDDFDIMFIPSGTYLEFPDSKLGCKYELISSYNEDAPADIAIQSKQENRYKGLYADALAEGDEAFVQCFLYAMFLRQEIDLYLKADGLPLYWYDEEKKQKAIELAKKSFWCVKAAVKEGEKPYYYDVQPLIEEMKWRFDIKQNYKDAVWDLKRMFYEVHCENVESGFYDPESPVFRDIVQKQAGFIGLKNIDIDNFIEKVDAWTFR